MENSNKQKWKMETNKNENKYKQNKTKIGGKNKTGGESPIKNKNKSPNRKEE